MINLNFVTLLCPWIWGILQKTITVQIITWLLPSIWALFQKSITVNFVAWLIPWIWFLIKVIFFGKFWYITGFFPFAFFIEYKRKLIDQKEKYCDDFKTYGSNMITREYTMVSTKGFDFSDYFDDLDIDKHENIASDENYLLFKNNGAHLEDFNNTPYNMETEYTQCENENPFFSIYDTDAVFTVGEGSLPLLPTNPFLEDCIKNSLVLVAGIGSPPLLATNPFFKDCINNPFVDISICFPNDSNHSCTDTIFAPTERDVYCNELTEQQRNYVTETAPLFSMN